jgi:uncharacterized protein YjbI with pentapeptide repeats
MTDQRRPLLHPAMLATAALAAGMAAGPSAAAAPGPVAAPDPAVRALMSGRSLCCLRTEAPGKAVGCVVPPEAPCRRLLPKGCEIGPGARCAGADLSGLDLRYADLRRADLRGARLIGTDLENADLRGAQLMGAHLIGTDMANAQLAGASLQGALLRSCDLESADLRGANLNDADAEGNDLESSNLAGARLRRIRLRGADLESVDLARSDASGADFSGANLARARLTDARLDGANLHAASLTATRMERTSLVGADLSRAHLGIRLVEVEEEDDVRLRGDRQHPCFPLASCSAQATGQVSDDTGVGALLVDTDLSQANLQHADLNGVVMLRGSLRGARMQGAETLDTRWLDVAVQRTTCPNGRRYNGGCPGFVYPAAGAERERALQRVTWLESLPWPWN